LYCKKASQPPQVVLLPEAISPSEKDENEDLTDEEIQLKLRDKPIPSLTDEDLTSLTDDELYALLQRRPELLNITKADMEQATRLAISE
jgi:urease accessory protein UreE